MTLLKKIKSYLLRKFIENEIVKIPYTEAKDRLDEIDRLVIFSEIKKIENIERFFLEWADSNRNLYYNLPEKSNDERLIVKGKTDCIILFLNSIREAPLKLKKIAEEVQRQQQNENV